MVESAVRTLRPTGNIETSQPEVRTLVMEFIQAGSGQRGVAVDDIINHAAVCGVSQEAVLAVIETLIIDDECYQPLKGFIKLL
jgi:hypothetical protein